MLCKLHVTEQTF